MVQPNATATPQSLWFAERAVAALRTAKNDLEISGMPSTLARVAKTLESAEAALRQIQAGCQRTDEEPQKPTAIKPASPVGYLTYRCPDCGSDRCGNDANSGWDAVTQQSCLLGEFDNQWCSDCGDVTVEEYIISDPAEIARIDVERAKFVVAAAASELLDASRWALSAPSDMNAARRKGYDKIVVQTLIAAIALAEGNAQ